ncbi:MAG: SH3 domain-containing protein [Pleurocapsa minor GSE-CHR-MK-17-07R]|jgi:uncharacterized protein YgiM (DUF1202 family)|nr:SH3 domain-containing protein [Pleurocapsa minor GSE-CHR-MK 17-07R]
MKRLLVIISLLAMALSVSGAALGQQLQQPIFVINTGALNVRTGPGPQFTIITSVRGGTEVPALALNPDASWALVATAAGDGWIYIGGEFTIARGDFRFVPTISAEEVIAASAQGAESLTVASGTTAPVPALISAQVIVNTGRLNIRTGPGPQFAVIGSVPGGTVLAGIGINGDGSWYYVISDLGEGWVWAEPTIFRGDSRALVQLAG